MPSSCTSSLLCWLSQRLAMLESSAVAVSIPLQSCMFLYGVCTKYSFCNKHNQKFSHNYSWCAFAKGNNSLQLCERFQQITLSSRMHVRYNPVEHEIHHASSNCFYPLTSVVWHRRCHLNLQVFVSSWGCTHKCQHWQHSPCLAAQSGECW
jgi:hypothetical protein